MSSKCIRDCWTDASADGKSAMASLGGGRWWEARDARMGKLRNEESKLRLKLEHLRCVSIRMEFRRC